MNRTKISWTDFSSNPLKARRLDNGKVGWACSGDKIPECANCYAAAMNMKGANPNWYGTGLDYTEQNIEKVEFFLDKREFHAWRKVKTPSRIFVVDMSDLFHPAVPDSFRDHVFDEMESCEPHHSFQVLTKRPGIMQKYIARRGRPSGNIWLGTSLGTVQLKPFIRILQQVNVEIRFLSIEPLLEPIGELDLSGISWVIVGGESGRRHRPMDKRWARDILRQCRQQGVAFFFKQSAGPKPGMYPYLDYPEGSELRRWEEYPGKLYEHIA